jgi:hypothetical protein
MNKSFLYILFLSSLLLLAFVFVMIFLFKEDPSDSTPITQAAIERPSNASREETEQGSINNAPNIKEMLDSLPNINSKDQEKIAQAIADQSDDNAAKNWSDLIILNALPQPATIVLFNDMKNRPPELLQPFLANIADQATHPQKNVSVKALEFIYDQPPVGENWKSWVKKQLENN